MADFLESVVDDSGVFCGITLVVRSIGGFCVDVDFGVSGFDFSAGVFCGGDSVVEFREEAKSLTASPNVKSVSGFGSVSIGFCDFVEVCVVSDAKSLGGGIVFG